MRYHYRSYRPKRSVAERARRLSEEELREELPNLRAKCEKLAELYEHAKAESERRASKTRARKEEVRRLVSLREQLRSAPTSKIRKTGFFISRDVLKDEVKQKIIEINRALGDEDPERSSPLSYYRRNEPYTDPTGREYTYLDTTLKNVGIEYLAVKKKLIAYENALQRVVRNHERLADERARSEAQKKRMRELRAISAQATGQTRDLAARMKKGLARSNSCPYCEGPLEEPHADHIYPVSKGGLSTEPNLVLVCQQCNIRKRNMTLRAFLLKYGYDRERVELRLSKLGKDV